MHTLINISLGAYCESLCQSYDGQLCEYEHATCGGYVQDCHGLSVKLKPRAFTVRSLLSKMHSGPAFHISDFPSDFLIGNAQFEAVHEIMESSAPKSVFSSPDTTTETANTIVLMNVKGPLRSVHVYMNM